MKPLMLASVLVGSVAVIAYAGASDAHNGSRRNEVVVAEPTHTVWDSVYTDSQSVRGDSLYKATCVKCHGATLAGGDDGTPLTGQPFFANWNGLGLNELFDRIRNSMPPDNPKSIPREQVTDILSYILAQNKFPAGRVPLTDSVERLSDIKILQNKP